MTAMSLRPAPEADSRHLHLCSGRENLTQLYGLSTRDEPGSDMKVYDTLLQKAVDSLAATFRKRRFGLQTARDFILPNEQGRF